MAYPYGFYNTTWLNSQNKKDTTKDLIESAIKDVKDSYTEYELAYPQKGYIKVQALTARKNFPIQGATVEIYKELGEGDYLISRSITDESGLTDVIPVPTPKKALSETPNSSKLPYSSYSIVVTHPDFIQMIFKNVPVFEDIISLQNADLMPKSSINAPIIINESEPNKLSGGE